MKRTVTRIYLQTVLFHILIVAAQQEMYFLTCMSQFGSVISSKAPVPMIPYLIFDILIL